MMRFTLLACALGLSLSCASDGDEKDSADKEGKHKFGPGDYGLAYLEPGKTQEALKPVVSEKVKWTADFIEQKLPDALAPVPPPAPTIIKIAVEKSKPIIVMLLEKALFKLIDENPKEIEGVMVRYNKFGPEMSYDLAEEPDNDAKAIVQRANDTLKRTFRTVRSLRLARNFLEVANVDAKAIKEKQDPAALAGIGVAGLVVTQLALEAIDHAKGLAGELKELQEALANEATQKPMAAFSLAGPSADVAGALKDLASVPPDAAALLDEASKLLELFKEPAPAG